MDKVRPVLKPPFSGAPVSRRECRRGRPYTLSWSHPEASLPRDQSPSASAVLAQVKNGL